MPSDMSMAAPYHELHYFVLPVSMWFDYFYYNFDAWSMDALDIMLMKKTLYRNKIVIQSTKFSAT